MCCIAEANESAKWKLRGNDNLCGQDRPTDQEMSLVPGPQVFYSHHDRQHNPDRRPTKRPDAVAGKSPTGAQHLGTYGIGSDTRSDRRGWPPWSKTITSVKEEEVESQVCSRIAWSCQYGFKSTKPYFRLPDIMRTAGVPPWHVLLAQSWPTLCNPMAFSPPGSSVCEILQAGNLEWGAIPFSRGTPDPGIKPGPPTLQADSTLWATREDFPAV